MKYNNKLCIVVHIGKKGKDMENNNMQPQYDQQYNQQYSQQYNQQYTQQYNPQYGQQYYPQYVQPIDPEYAATAKDFLTKAIVACAISSIPVGSIIAIFMASKNREAILDYIARGGLHTDRIKVSSCLSRAGKYSGIACTVLWGFYFLYFAFVFVVMIISIIASTRG